MQGSFSESSLFIYNLLVSDTLGCNYGESKEDSYDFTRCVRPDGSAYGTAGNCRKGKEQDKELVQSVKETSKAGASEPVKVKAAESSAKEKTAAELEKEWSDMQKKMMELIMAGNKKEGNSLLPEVMRLREEYSKAQDRESPAAPSVQKPEKPEKLSKEMQEELKLEALQKKLDLRQKKAESKLTEEEKKALADYTYDTKKGPRSYAGINKCLRTGKCSGEESSRVIAELDSVINKLPSNTDGDPFYRVMFPNNSAAKQLYKTLLGAKPGDKFTDPGFSSYSSDRNIAEELVSGPSILFVSRNKKLTPINLFSSLEREQEALLPRGTAQTILSVKKEGDQLIVEID